MAMREKKKRKGVSRREFLKGLGQGAVGAAVISTGLLRPGRLEAAAPNDVAKKGGSSMSVDIPGGLNYTHLAGVHAILEQVLLDIEREANVQPLWVSCRLNKTGATDDRPVFVGFLEHLNQRAVRARNYPDPGLYRFTDDHRSTHYWDCLKVANRDRVVRKKWKNGGKVDAADSTSKRIGELWYEEKHRTSIAIKVGKLYVGTLNAGFKDNPPASVDKVLIRWAQQDSGFTRHLQRNFNLSGTQVT